MWSPARLCPTSIRRSSIAAVLAVPIVILVAGCSDATGPTQVSRESEHFHFFAALTNATVAEVEQGIDLAETHFAKIAQIVGAGRTPSRRIAVWLEGDKRSGVPDHVDGQGTVHIHRYADPEIGYFSSLAHELTHAFRYDHWQNVAPWPAMSFYEEGFAEFVALRADPGKRGFPLFGHSEDVVAGHWVVSGDGLPPSLLRERPDLNTPCEHQAYPMRSSWFSYIDDVYGRQAVVEIAYATSAATSAAVVDALGVSLSELDAAWAAWLVDRYAAIPNADELADAYRNRIGSSSVCVEGVDY